jgi:hypothetical protein
MLNLFFLDWILDCLFFYIIPSFHPGYLGVWGRGWRDGDDGRVSKVHMGLMVWDWMVTVPFHFWIVWDRTVV